MPQYKVEIPGQGTFNVDSPEELTDEQAYMAVMQDLRPKKKEEPAPAEPTLGGQFKEFAKGVIPGAVGMGQTALTGLSALLPEVQEKAARQAIERGGEALKAPFAAAPGYGDTVGRKFGEAAGSILPFVAMGPFGAAGRAGMVGLGVGAGAGEARIRAEQEGATPEQRATATALGTIPGAFEVFAPMQMLGRLSAPIQQGIMASVKRALVAGGEEAAQEAASQIAQNLIAKGVYKPDQAIIEQVGESAAYGGATGALVQGIMDMALGRRAKGAPQTQAGQPPVAGAQPLSTTQPEQPTAEIPEPTVRGAEPELETPEEIAAGPTAKAQAAQAKKLAAEHAAFLKQYEEQAAKRAAEAAEYERVKALTPEEYALEQMQGIKAKKTKPASQEELNAQLAELGYQTEPTPPAPPVVPGADYAAQQIALAKDREPIPNNMLYASYLMQDPEQARVLVQNQTPIPGVSQKDSNILLGGLKTQLVALDKQLAQQKAQTEGTAQERARGLFAQQGADQTSDFMAGAREQRGNAVVRPEIQALQRIGNRPSPYLTANRDVEENRKTEGLVDSLVGTLPLANGKITPGDVYLGLGTKKQDVRDLQAQLAVARMTRNRDLQNEIKRELDKKRELPTEGGLGTEGGKNAAEFLGRSKMPEMRAYEAEGDKFAAEQRSTLLGMARMLASPKIMLPATRQKALSDAKEMYVAQHAAEIEARRKAFGFGPMEDWERAEARARALEGLNTLTNNWGRFEDPVISVKALQNISREAVYQNILKAAQRKTETEQTGLAEKTKRPTGGPRLAPPDELTLKGTPRRSEDTKQDALDMVTMALTRTKRVSPTETKQKSVRSLDELAALFKKAEVGGTTVDMEPATIGLLEQLRDALPTSTDPEFDALAREQAQRIVEGNLPNSNDVRELGEMLALQEEGKRSATRPGATPEELQRTSAQPQKELFPEAAVQVQRATPGNFQKMLDSKDIQGTRDAIEKQRKENLATLQSVSKNIPNIKNRLAKAEEKYKRTQKKAQAAGTESAEYKKEFEEDYSLAHNETVRIKDEIAKVEAHLDDIEYMQNALLSEPTDMRLLINAPGMLAQEKPLRAMLKQLQTQLSNAQTLTAAITAHNKAMQTLAVPANKRAEATLKQLDAAQKELSDVKTEAAKEAAKAKAEVERERLAKEKAARELGTAREAFNRAAQAGREGLGLEGMRIQRDTTALKNKEHELRSKLGSLEDQLDKAKSDKKKSAIQAKIDETTQELDSLPSMAPAVRTDLGDRTQVDLDFEAEQIANSRRLNEKLGLTGGLPAPIKGPVEKNIRTGRTSQSGRRIDLVGKSDAVTNALLARRGELSDINMRIGMLEQAKKPIPEKLAKLKDRAEKRVEKARVAQEGVAKLEKETRSALSLANRKEIESELKRAAQTGEEPQFARGVETTSPDLTVSQVDALENNDIRQAMRDIATDGNTSKLNQVVAERLAAMLDQTKVEIKSNLTDSDGKSVLGDATSKQVRLNRNGGLSQEILLHEGTHAATERVLVQYETDPTKLTEVQRVAVRELKALHAAIKNDPRITSASAKGSLSEFVAEVFSNKNLQNQLRNKKWRLSDAWKGFKSIIMRMLGVKDPETMLGAALQSVDALMIPSSQRMGGKEKAVTRNLSAKDIAALHTGSNSMRQFAEAFGTTHIKQKDRTAEDANRIGQDYLDDMYSNPLDYVAPADRLSYKVFMADGKPYDPTNALHYVEAEAADFAMLKAQEDLGLQERESLALTAQRKKDLKALVKNLGDSGEYTNVEQALVAKAASKWAVLSDKSGRLKLVTIEPNNRHDIAVVSAADAGRVIEELRAGKPLKEAFLAGMQKNADANAKNNERKTGWQKFEQSDTEQAAVALNAGAANTPWCTGASVGTARSQISKGDFYIYYKDGRPEVAVRMDGQDNIGEVRGNSPNQAINAEQEQTARSFLQGNKFNGADKYLNEFDNRRFLIDLLRGDTEYSIEALFNNPPLLNNDGTIANRAAKDMLTFRTLDGYAGRPAPEPEVVEQIRGRMQKSLDSAEAQGYYPTKSARLGSKGLEIDKKIVDLSTVKGVKNLTISGVSAQVNGQALVPNLEYANSFELFTGANFKKLKQVGTITVFGDVDTLVVTTPRDAKINAVRPASSGALIIEGPERVNGIMLQRGYGENQTLDLTLPDTKYVSVEPPRDNFAGSINWRASQLLKKAGMPTDIDTQENVSTVVDGLHALADAMGTKVVEALDSRLNDPETQGELVSLNSYYNLLATAILETEGYTQTRQSSPERQAAANRIAKKINQEWYLEGIERFGEKGGTLTAPKRVEETFTETPETPRYARAQAAGFEDALETANSIIAAPKTLRQRVDANLGLGFRTQVLDRLAPLEKVSQAMTDSLKGTQMMYYLRMADQKMSFVQQAVGRGVPQLVDHKRADGRIERLIESKNGPSLANVVNTLKNAPDMNAEAANKLFTLYLAAKRGDRVGYDVLNFGVPEATIKRDVAKIEANKELREVFEKAREQYNDYNRDLMKFLEATGAITPEEAARLAKTNDYIPYYREENGNAVLVIGGEGTFKMGNLTDQPQLRQLIGGNDKILDFLTSSVQNTSMIMDMGLRNQATKNAMFELADLKMAQFLGGEPSGSDIVRFKDKGVDKYVRVNTEALGIPSDLLVKGMEGIPVNNSAVVKAMGGFSTLLRRSITISPLYSMRQIFRDSVAAPLLSGADFVPVLGALNQIGKVATREKLEARGIVGGQIFTGTNEDLTRILGELQAGKMGISQFIAKAEAIAMEADALTRRAQYDSYIAQGLSDMEATLMSLESMNFNRKGLSPSARMASTIIPFFNAQLQSLDVLYRAMTGQMPMNERLKIQEKLFARGALLAGTAVAYALLMQDDDTYKNANPDEKYGNFFVHVPGIKEALRIPVPFEIGYIFKSLPEAIVNTMASDKGGEEALKAFKNIAIQTVPGGTSMFLPAALKPAVENVTNYNFYSGRSLETKAEQMEQAQYRFRDNTSEFAKQLGAATGTSPIKIENLIRGYTGSMGVALAQAFNFSMPTSGTPEQATKRLSDAAVIGPLFQPEDAGGQVGAVYDRIQTLTETKRTFDKLAKEGRGAEAREFLQNNAEDYAKSAVAGNVQEQLSKITQAANAVKASSLSPDQKREQLDRLQALRIRIASTVRGAL